MNYKIAVYGSLRVGQYNYERFKHGLKVIETNLILRNHQLYSLGSYPAIIFSENDNDRVIVDILECDKETFDRIYNMEISAGYIMCSRQIGNHHVSFYVYDQPVTPDNLIRNGDWNKYLRLKVENV